MKSDTQGNSKSCDYWAVQTNSLSTKKEKAI